MIKVIYYIKSVIYYLYFCFVSMSALNNYEFVKITDKNKEVHVNPREVVENMDKRYAMFGYMFAMNNRLQTVADKFYEEITCKQFFFLACMELFPDAAPTIGEMAEVMGCSHQNAKSIVNKLREKGFLELQVDKEDKRKQRIISTKKQDELNKKNDERAELFMNKLFEGIEPDELAGSFSMFTKMEENLNEISDNL